MSSTKLQAHRRTSVIVSTVEIAVLFVLGHAIQGLLAGIPDSSGSSIELLFLVVLAGAVTITALVLELGFQARLYHQLRLRNRSLRQSVYA